MGCPDGKVVNSNSSTPTYPPASTSGVQPNKVYSISSTYLTNNGQ